MHGCRISQHLFLFEGEIMGKNQNGIKNGQNDQSIINSPLSAQWCI